MSTIEKLNASVRTEVGSTGSRRLRSQGIVPATLYGHQEGPATIQVQGEEIHAVIKDGAKVFDLDVDGKIDKVLLRDVQWDTFSKHVLHADFLRVDPNERIHIEVPVILRGTAPGVAHGGILEQPMHSIEIECLTVQVPDAIQVRIGALEIGDKIQVSDLVDLPKGVTPISPADSVVVQVSEIQAAPEPTEEEDGGDGAAAPTEEPGD